LAVVSCGRTQGSQRARRGGTTAARYRASDRPARR
jgi:hypothetical protein